MIKIKEPLHQPAKTALSSVVCVCMCVCVSTLPISTTKKKKKKTLRVKKAEARHQRRCTFLYAHLQFKLDLRKRENSLIEKKK